MKKTIVFVSSLIILIIILTVYYFNSSINTYKKSDIYQFLNKNNPIILHFNYNPQNLDLLVENSSYTNLLSSSLKDELGLMDSLLKSLELDSKIQNQDVVIALRKNSATTSKAIYLTHISLTKYELENVFSVDEAQKPNTRTYESENIYMLLSNKLTLYYIYIKEHLIVSTHVSLIEEAIRNYKNKVGLSSDPKFTQWIENNTDKEELAYLFVNYASLNEFSLLFFNKAFSSKLSYLDKAAEYSMFELRYKNNAFILNGELTSLPNQYYDALKG